MQLAEPSDALRAETFRRLDHRNAMVGALRIVVPLLGLAAFALLIAQIWAASFARQYGVAGIRIDRGNLVVDTPKYSGMGGDGSRYVVNAREARAPLSSPEVITMRAPALELTRAGRAPLFAATDEAVMNTSTQIVDIAGLASISSADGLEGTLSDVHTNITAGTTEARGPVSLRFADGMSIVAASMVYDGATWNFTRATVTLAELPRGEADGATEE